jgi:hypothetical protein
MLSERPCFESNITLFWIGEAVRYVPSAQRPSILTILRTPAWGLQYGKEEGNRWARNRWGRMLVRLRLIDVRKREELRERRGD